MSPSSRGGSRGSEGYTSLLLSPCPLCSRLRARGGHGRSPTRHQRMTCGHQAAGVVAPGGPYVPHHRVVRCRWFPGLSPTPCPTLRVPTRTTGPAGLPQSRGKGVRRVEKARSVGPGASWGDASGRLPREHLSAGTDRGSVRPTPRALSPLAESDWQVWGGAGASSTESYFRGQSSSCHPRLLGGPLPSCLSLSPLPWFPQQMPVSTGWSLTQRAVGECPLWATRGHGRRHHGRALAAPSLGAGAGPGGAQS